MNDKKTKYSTITKIGPIVKIEGGIFFKHPFKSKPIKGYDENAVLTNSEPFLNSISNAASDWFKNFPNCCEAHKQISQLGEFHKKDYEFIPAQILNNVKYFAFALEKFINTENGLTEIKDYLDYLIESFGSPGIGTHIFVISINHFIENGQLEGKSFTDDQRLELLTHLEPNTPQTDLSERDIETLYKTFQKWLEITPEIGEFKKLKGRYSGKVPFNLFLIEPKYNKYTGLTKYKTRSKKEFQEFLLIITNEIIKTSRVEIKREEYDNNKLLKAAEERLKVKQELLAISENSRAEKDYLELIEDWLSMIIEYYQVISQIVQENEMSIVSKNTSDTLSKINSLQLELTSICNTTKSQDWITKYLSSEGFVNLISELEKVEEEELNGILESISNELKKCRQTGFNFDEFRKKKNNPEISLKQKLTFSIPLFLFTRYEAEIEISNKQRIPRNFKEFRNILTK